MTKNKEQGTRKRCTNRSWGLTIDDTGDLSPKEVFDRFLKTKFGVLQGCAVRHSKEGSAHVHVALIMRDKPAAFYWDEVTDYFGKGVVAQPLKCKSRDFDKKCDMYYEYMVSEAKHPGEEISEPHLHKYEPTLVSDGVNLAKCPTKVWFLYHIKEGKTFREIVEEADLKREADLYMDMQKYKKMFNNYKKFNRDDTVMHELSEFKSTVVEDIKRQWNPKNQTLILKGPSNMGKTELSKALLKSTSGDAPKLISNLNQLNYRDPHQPMLLDDMNFSKISRSKLIALLDIENTRGIRVLYDVHEIEAGTHRILTTNEELFQLFSSHDKACTRRFCCIDLSKYGKLYE